MSFIICSVVTISNKKGINFYPMIYVKTEILIRIDPPHPLVCRKRRLNGAVLRMRPEKPRPRVTAGLAR
jgi:hypothetical protein